MKINVGSGGTPLEGYANIDRTTGGEAFPLSQDGTIFETDSADEIRASHVLEHFSHRETMAVLREWVRVLKPGGILKVAVPNLDYAYSQIGKHPHAEMWIMGGHVDDNDKHGRVFNRQSLVRMLDEVGLVEIDFWHSQVQDCASLPVSLNICGAKTHATKNVDKPNDFIIVPPGHIPISDGVKTRAIKPRKILGIMSVPRTGFLHTHGCIEQIFAAFGIQMQMYFGAFWEQGIQNAMKDAIANGFDDVITLDYDSVFDQVQFQRMWGLWHTNESIDALSCLQPQRGTGQCMLTPKGGEYGANLVQLSINHTDSGTQVRTAHFGLTFIRLSKLKDIQKPWFWSQPDKDGEWKKEGCVDADIYFWRKWEAAGNNLHLLTDVLLGHLEILIGQIDPKTGMASYRMTSEWNKDPFRGRFAAVDAPKKDVEKDPHDYNALAVYHPDLENYDTDLYPTSFHQRGPCCLGEPSTDFSGSVFQNVVPDKLELERLREKNEVV